MSYKETKIYKAHKAIGFPKINNSTQFEILINHNYEPIKSLIPEFKESGFPLGILNEYISVTKEQLKEHLKSINYLESQLKIYSETYDGYWLRKLDDGYEFFERERGNEFGNKLLKSKSDALDVYTKIIGSFCK
jgi:hypothetical protein